MRAGGYTVHQALSANAATVLKLALALARCRGHAQLTPLHVAFTLLRSPSSSSSSSGAFASSPSDPPPFGCCPGDAGDGTTASCCAYGLLRRACGRAHPAAAPPHPRQCRALELCFNVALNRLPVTNFIADAAAASSISASLAQPDPTLSNALVAALKRAQANQRRGCSVELHHGLQPPPPPQVSLQMQQQQQQPLLAIKVELNQLVISILDDPSVSRVMREAGFSSAAVKTSLEEEAAAMISLPTCLGHHVAAAAACVEPPHIGAQWPAQFSSCKEEDVRAIVEVMVRRQGMSTRTNPVVVGDTASVAEAAVAELVRRVETGRDVPDDLWGARVLRVHLSYVHLRLMTRADVDAQVAELRRAAHAVVADANDAGVVIYVGDMRWAIDDDGNDHALVAGYSTAEDHMVAELARLMSELRAASRGRAWIVAAASYQTYVRCQRQRRRGRAPSLEAAWSLQPVVVPADDAGIGLALGRCADVPPAPSPRVAEDDQTIKVGEIPTLDLALGGDNAVPALCAECFDGYEKEDSLVRAKADGTTLALTYFPGWPQANEPQTSHKAELMELRKWSSLCQRVHSRSHNDQAASIASPMPWWCSTMSRDGEAQTELNDPSSAGLRLSFGTPADHHGRGESDEQGAYTTTLNLLFPDSAAAAATYHDTRDRWSEGIDGDLAVQGSDAAIDAASGVHRRVWLDELLLSSGDLKRKAQESHLSREPKRRRGLISLDLNLCVDGEEEDYGDGGDDSEEEAAPSDLTNEGQSDDVELGRRRRNDCVGSD